METRRLDHLVRVACALSAFGSVASAQVPDWQQIPVTGPGARAGHAMAFDEQRAVAVLFGGSGTAGESGDTWIWNGTAWNTPTGPAPAARSGHTLAFDTLRGRTVLFGGRAGATLFGDTWEWDGSAWQQRPGSGPLPRRDHAATFDSLRGRVVVFGGVTSSGSLADTWEYDGATWLARLFANGPVAREGSALAYDRGRGRTVMFGGRGAAGVLGDTWDWDGTAWVLRASIGPAPRAGHVLVYDTGKGRCALFGGSDGATSPAALGDTWEWTGSYWMQRLTTPGAARAAAAAVFDQRRGVHVLFGGDAGGGPLGDTWERAIGRPGSSVTFGLGCGSPPLALVQMPGAEPILGRTATAGIQHVPAAFTSVALGFDRAWFGAFPLPVTLAAFGLPGCDLLQSSELAMLPTAPAGPGAARFDLALPNATVLLGMHLYLQAWASAPGQNQAGLIVSNGLDWVIGDGAAALAAIDEDFNDDSHLDHDVSAGSWANGLATFANVGGDGRHGHFAPELGQSLGLINGKRTFRFNTDSTPIPAANTRDGVAVTVTDGRFFFDSMYVPADVRLRFIGTHPPVFTVAGRLQIDGEIDIAGASLTTVQSNTNLAGQPGAAGGVFGGAGGQGGDRCSGTGYLPNYDGQNGQDAQILAGRAYAASATGSGGRGSHCFPVSGLSSGLIFSSPTGIYYTPSAAAGGGGGGHAAAGGIGQVVSNNWVDPVLLVPPLLAAMGPAAPGGTAVQFFPFPAPTGSPRSSLHFLVGGAGGGGAGSQATLCIAAVNPRIWCSGGGGGGGGGAIALRAGDSLEIGPLAAVLANGGNAASHSGMSTISTPAPGGGGSGGSIVLQSGRAVNLQGGIDVRGGNGGTFNRASSPSTPPQGAIVQIAGGAGSPGFVRCELPGSPTPAVLATMLPAATANNVGTLAEVDDLVAFQSTWYSTNLAAGPEYQRYEIRATVDGVPVMFSDDPAVSVIAAGPGAPVRALFQTANLDLVTGQPAPLPGGTVPEIRPWRAAILPTATQIGMATEGLNGFRFVLMFDRSVATTVTIDSVRVVYRG